MVVEECAFETERLSIHDWHPVSVAVPSEQALVGIVASMMTASVTRALPAGWQGGFTQQRAQEWISERDREGAGLVAVERSSATPVGLLMLHQSGASERAGVDVRIGYLLAETSWGRGLGSELVEGLVEWAHARPDIHSLIAGVAADNQASIRILKKTGFVSIDAEADGPQGELMLQLRLR
jgi:RimJ/RimL family protein N-acetyltransferase